jgi:hypothetical protein
MNLVSYIRISPALILRMPVFCILPPYYIKEFLGIISRNAIICMVTGIGGGGEEAKER